MWRHFDPQKTPYRGANIKNHAIGKMLKVVGLMDRQHAGKLLRFFFNGSFYQPRFEKDYMALPCVFNMHKKSLKSKNRFKHLKQLIFNYAQIEIAS